MMTNNSSAAVIVKKRERTQNWIPEEKNALFSLIKMHANVIENKKVDAGASALKTLAWQQIHQAFRGRFSTERDITRIREQWRRMKAQARIEMYTFAEKVKHSTAEEAAKCRPSNLSIEVWRLLENARKNDCDCGSSDESVQDTAENNPVASVRQILKKLKPSVVPEVAEQNVKIEVNSDAMNSEEDTSPTASSSRKSDTLRRNSTLEIYGDDEPIDLAEQKFLPQERKRRLDHRHQHHHHHLKNANPDESDCCEGEATVAAQSRNEISEYDGSVQKAVWMFEANRKEHDFKLRVLKIELERAEIEKQTALNKLKTSDIKRQLMEDQAADYYNQVRMVGEPGSGAGKGGGGGGSIRDAGGAFGKMEAAHEDQYFYNQQKEQLKKLREGLHDEISFHEEQIKRHQEAINRHKKRITDMNKE